MDTPYGLLPASQLSEKYILKMKLPLKSMQCGGMTFEKTGRQFQEGAFRNKRCKQQRPLRS